MTSIFRLRYLSEKTSRLSQSPSLTLRLEQAQNVVLAHWALDVADDAAGGVVHELDADLGHTSTRTGAAEDSGNLDELDWDLGGIHFDVVVCEMVCLAEMWSEIFVMQVAGVVRRDSNSVVNG